MEYRLSFILFLFILILSCQKDDSANPFNNVVNNQDTVGLNIVNADPNSIAGIYQNILRPTCANVACHDGAFEPDFRTIESSYNTMVYQTPIKNDGNYQFRVAPFMPDSSVIIARLEDIIGPQMPFQVEPDSDWPNKRDEYIQNIKTWIADGARDISGNIREEVYPAPILLGAGASISDLWALRSGGTGPIQMPPGANLVDFYFSFEHESLPSQDLTFNKVAFSTNPNDFSGTEMWSLEILSEPRNERGFFGENVEYTHKISVDVSSTLDPNENFWYFRVYIKDDVNEVTEIPTDNGIYYIKNYMSFERI